VRAPSHNTRAHVAVLVGTSISTVRNVVRSQPTYELQPRMLYPLPGMHRARRGHQTSRVSALRQDMQLRDAGRRLTST
jgi:hypothetical protein